MEEASSGESLSRDLPVRPRLLLVSMYPLDAGLWGPTVRITHLRDELARLVRLDVVAGYRPARRRGLLRYAFSGRLRGLDGVYVEASSFLPAETDLAFLAIARAMGIPILTYFRDAYQLFPEYYPIDSPRRWIAARAFLPAMRLLAAVSSRLATPSPGLAKAMFGARQEVVILPPGAPSPIAVPLDPGARDLLFVGDARHEPQGADRLMKAVGIARSRGAEVTLTLVCRPGEEPPDRVPDYARLLRAEGPAIEALLPGVLATVIPRRMTPYNDLALPVKLFEYLAYGRPLLVTDCEETARVVRDAGCGLVVGDAPDDLAAGIVHLAALPSGERQTLGHAAAVAARRFSWAHRAHAILDALGVG